MILRVVPPAPGLTILFTLSFPALPSSLPFPPAWSSSLSLAISHNLPPPPSAHALDRACTTVELLHSVTFDITRLQIECRVADSGELLTFPLTPLLLQALEQVCADVTRSTEELDREKRGLPPRPLTPPYTRPSTPLESPSLLSLLSSFLPAFPSAPSSPTTPTRSLAGPPTPASRFYRRAARSRLVDAYAQHVQPLLSAQLASKGVGGWAAWQARSALRKASQELDDLLAPTSEPPSPASSVSSCSEFPALPPTPALSHSSGPSTPSTPSSSTARFPSSLSTQQLSSYSRLTSRIQELKGLLATLEERERDWRDGDLPRRLRPGYVPARSGLAVHVLSAEELEMLEQEEEMEEEMERTSPFAAMQLHLQQQGRGRASFPMLPSPPLPSSLPPPPTRMAAVPALVRSKHSRGVPFESFPRRKPVPLAGPTAFRIPPMVVDPDDSEDDRLTEMDVDEAEEEDVADVVMRDCAQLEVGPLGGKGRRRGLDLPREVLAGW